VRGTCLSRPHVVAGAIDQAIAQAAQHIP